MEKNINKYKYYKKQNELIEKNNEEEIISNNNKFINKNNTYNVYKENNLKSNAGITIITLVVTILIIIILASITINAVLGDDGLLRQAQDAKDLAESTTLETGDKMNSLLQEYVNMMAEDGGGIQEPEEDTTPPTVVITTGEITENSIEIQVTANDPESGLASENAYIYYLNGAEYTRGNSSSCTFTGLTAETMYTIKVEVINGVGIKGEDSTTITTSSKPGLSAEEISQNPSAYYGDEVTGYSTDHSETSNAVETWRLFYADESNIYLIADDYIASSYVPDSRAGNSLSTRDDYNFYLYDIRNDYNGASDIGTTHPARKWLDTYLNSYGSSTTNPMKDTAYLMDTTVWNIYVGEYAEYAIGGPTLELFCASYQDTHPSKYIQCDGVNSYGYQIKWSNGSSYVYSVNGLSTSEYRGIYIKASTSKARTMRFASPSGSSSGVWFSARYDGTVLSGDGVSADGLRPIVCLKSDVHLEVVNSGTLAIVQ